MYGRDVLSKIATDCYVVLSTDFFVHDEEDTMSHNVETMAYAGEVPWHGLGERVSNDLTPMQMMQKAGVDWRVTKVPTVAMYDGEIIETGTEALIRESDNSVLAPMVGQNWEPIQNNGTRCYVTNVQVQKDGWSAEAQAIIDNAGRTDKPYTPGRVPLEGDVAYGKNAEMFTKGGNVDYGAVGHLAQFAVDGNPRTSAMAKDLQDYILEVDLLEVFAINKVLIKFAENHAAETYTVSASRDGVDWTEVATKSGAGKDEHRFAEMDARYVRLTSAAGGSKMGVASIHVFGGEAKKRSIPKPVKFNPPAADVRRT